MATSSSTIRGTWVPANLRYFLLLALRSFRRDRLLTISTVLTLGVGIAASMTVFSILHVLAGDPIPGKSTGCSDPRSQATSRGMATDRTSIPCLRPRR